MMCCIGVFCGNCNEVKCKWRRKKNKKLQDFKSSKRVKKTGEIITKGTSKYTTVTICKYEYYQADEDKNNEERANKGQSKDKRGAIKRQTKGNRQEW